MRYDLAIIGSGAAGFAAAIAARGNGRSVVMIERGTVVRTCVNTGCVPSKAQRAAAEARHGALAQRFPGIATSAGAVGTATLHTATDQLVHRMRADKYVGLAAGYGWTVLSGQAQFVDGPALDVALDVALAAGGRKRVVAEHYLVASGSSPSAPPIPGLADAGYLTSTTALALEKLLGSMIVLGGGAIGLELGQLFARLAHTGRLLGAHVAADAAGEVIAAAVFALANHMTVQQMAELWWPYLTMAEALKLAAQSFTCDISRLSCCAA
jgi:mercuric reductase